MAYIEGEFCINLFGFHYCAADFYLFFNSSDRVIIPGAYRQSTATQSMLIRCSQHNPVVNYATYGRHLFSLDIRCDRVGAYLYSTGNSAITAVSDSVDPHSLLVAVGQDIALMDSRFLKTFVSKRRVGQLTTMMKSIYGHSLLAGNGKWL